jgi:hypothetical protein
MDLRHGHETIKARLAGSFTGNDRRGRNETKGSETGMKRLLPGSAAIAASSADPWATAFRDAVPSARLE